MIFFYIHFIVSAKTTNCFAGLFKAAIGTRQTRRYGFVVSTSPGIIQRANVANAEDNGRRWTINNCKYFRFFYILNICMFRKYEELIYKSFSCICYDSNCINEHSK